MSFIAKMFGGGKKTPTPTPTPPPVPPAVQSRNIVTPSVEGDGRVAKQLKKRKRTRVILTSTRGAMQEELGAKSILG